MRRALIQSLWFSFLFAATLASTLDVHAGTSDGRLDIYFIDVEGGAATLIVTPGNESLLIDSGYPQRRSRSGSHSESHSRRCEARSSGSRGGLTLAPGSLRQSRGTGRADQGGSLLGSRHP